MDGWPDRFVRPLSLWTEGPDVTDLEAFDPSAIIEEHGLFSWLDLRVESIEDGRAVVVVPDDEKLRNIGEGGGTPIHGGVAATVIDTVSGFALRTTFDDPMEARLTTTDLNVSYLRPAMGDLRATAEVVRSGGSMGVVEVDVTAPTPEGEDTVAVGRASYRLFRGEER
jgi:uncharacterized protein (TIGR00369 family)